MKRLIDSPPEHRLMARAHELIVATGPTRVSEARMRKVRRSLDEPAQRPRRARWLHAGIALALVGTGATAFAVGGALERSATPATALPRPRPGQPAAPITPAPAERETAPTTASSPPPSPAAPSALSGRRVPTAPPPAAASDVARVHEAARALRGEGDAARAQRLLEAGGEITGPLAEEALALRIEAARARSDARATSLSRSYLARYPRGRYRDLAERTLAERKSP